MKKIIIMLLIFSLSLTSFSINSFAEVELIYGIYSLDAVFNNFSDFEQNVEDIQTGRRASDNQSIYDEANEAPILKTLKKIDRVYMPVGLSKNLSDIERIWIYEYYEEVVFEKDGVAGQMQHFIDEKEYKNVTSDYINSDIPTNLGEVIKTINSYINFGTEKKEIDGRTIYYSKADKLKKFAPYSSEYFWKQDEEYFKLTIYDNHKEDYFKLCDAETYHLKGWRTENGIKCYYKNGKKATGLVNIYEVRHVFAKDGKYIGKYTGYTKKGDERCYYKDGNLIFTINSDGNKKTLLNERFLLLN